MRIARVTAGLSQNQLAARAGLTQSAVSRAERGLGPTSLEALCRMSAAAGHEVGLRLHPVQAVRLRDSGQLEIAEWLAREAHPSWDIQMEVPVGPADARAADLLLRGPAGTIHVEIERTIVDLQAQLRSAQQKRQALTDALGTTIRLVLVVPDTARNRQRLEPIRELLDRTLPATAREILAVITSGTPLERDGILFVRLRKARTRG